MRRKGILTHPHQHTCYQHNCHQHICYHHTHTINASSHPTFSTLAINTYYHHTHTINTPSHPTFSTLPSQPFLSTHRINKPSHATFSTLPYQPFLSTHHIATQSHRDEIPVGRYLLPADSQHRLTHIQHNYPHIPITPIRISSSLTNIITPINNSNYSLISYRIPH